MPWTFSLAHRSRRSRPPPTRRPTNEHERMLIGASVSFSTDLQLPKDEMEIIVHFLRQHKSWLPPHVIRIAQSVTKTDQHSSAIQLLHGLRNRQHDILIPCPLPTRINICLDNGIIALVHYLVSALQQTNRHCHSHRALIPHSLRHYQSIPYPFSTVGVKRHGRSIVLARAKDAGAPRKTGG